METAETEEAVSGGGAETPELLPLWYVLPEGFTTVDLTGDSDERFEEIYDNLAGLYPEATPEQIVSSALSFEVTVAVLVSEGAVHLSSFLLQAGDGLLGGLCQMKVVDRPAGDPNLYPNSVLRSGDLADDRIEKGIVELPAGLAAVIIKEEDVTTPGTVFGVTGNIASHVRSVTFQIAFPGQPQAVSVSLSTEDTEHGDEFLELATLVAGGISFEPPPVPPTEAEIAVAERIQEDVRSTFG